MGSTCDKIEEEKNIALFGERLPLYFVVNSYLPYSIEKAEYTLEEARAIAASQLESEMRECIGDAEILFRRDSFFPGESSVRVECEIVCIENIALVKEFDTEYN